MCRIDLKFYCDLCGSLLYETSAWGSYSNNLIEYLQKNIACKHKHKSANNPKNIFYKIEFVYPEIRLGEPIINYDAKDDFTVQYVEKIVYNYPGEEIKYYYKDDKDNSHIVEFPNYTYMEFNDPKTVMQFYHNIAYISEHGILNYSEIINAYSVVENYKQINYLSIDGKNSIFYLEDVYELSHLLMEFDMYNINAKTNPINVEHINKRIKLYKEFKKYWMDKYYKDK